MSGLHDVLRALQEQHDGLRVVMDECEWLADELDHGRGELTRLNQEVVKLRAAFVEHSKFEELALDPFVDTADAPSIDDVRSDHAEEHRALSHGLDGTTAELRVTLYRLRAHLAAEERYFRPARML